MKLSQGQALKMILSGLASITQIFLPLAILSSRVAPGEGAYGILRLVVPGSNDVEFCYQYNSDWVTLPSSPAPATQVAAAAPALACEELQDPGKLRNKAVLADRGKCTFLDKILNVQEAGGSAAIFINVNETGGVTPFVNATNTSLIHIPVGVVNQRDGSRIRGFLDSGKQISVSVFSPAMRFFDYSMLVIGAYATFLVGLGAILANPKPEKRANAGDEGGSGSGGDEGIPEVTLDANGVGMMLGGMTVVLVLLFLLYKYLVYVMIGMFCIGSLSSLTFLMSIVLQRLPHGRIFTIPVIFADVSAKDMVVFSGSLVIVITWVAGRNSDWAWILQDILGSSLILCLFKSMRLPSLKMSSLLLCSFFAYDIFMVFITPLFTPKGESVMVKVATGGGESTEQMPMVMKFPYMDVPYTYEVCQLGRGMSLLGFGDVVIPGLFISFLLHCDRALRGNVKQTGRNRLPTYFLVGITSYALGLVLTDFGLLHMQMAQPALMYLVPATLIPAILQAKYRGEISMLWEGKVYPVEYALLEASVDELGTDTDSLDDVSDETALRR